MRTVAAFCYVLSIALWGCVAAPTSRAASLKYKNILLFGDSYTDNCNTWRLETATPAQQAMYPFPSCPPAPIGRADSGEQWPELLPGIVSGINVVDLAYAAATCNNSLFNRSPILDVGQQITYYQTNVSRLAPADTLVAIYIGTNDLTFLVDDLTGAFGPANFASVANVSVNAAAQCVLGRIEELYNAGYKNQLILQNIPLQDTALFSNTTATSNGTEVALVVQSFVQSNNALQMAYIQLFNETHSDANIQIFPTFDLYANIVADPVAYLGTGAVVAPPCTADPSFNATAVNVCQGYVFANTLHPSQATGYILAQEVAKYLYGGVSNYNVNAGLGPLAS